MTSYLRLDHDTPWHRAKTNQFIQLAATKRSTPGLAYQVKCRMYPPPAVSTWLSQEPGVIRPALRLAKSKCRAVVNQVHEPAFATL